MFYRRDGYFERGGGAVSLCLVVQGRAASVGAADVALTPAG